MSHSRLVAACVLVLAVCVVDPASAKRRDCPTRGEQVVAVSKVASVFAVPGRTPRRRLYRACDRATGRSFDLVSEGNAYVGTLPSSRPT